MPTRDAKPLTIKPFGVCDVVDGTNAPPGSMMSLQNLIPNPTTQNTFTCRPASVKITNFSGFTSPGFISVILIQGNLVWGMIATGRNTGYDEPFCYNISTASFVTISNVTSANVPKSPATTGDWTAPVLASITNGRIVLTHPGYAAIGGANYIGWLDTSSYSNASGSATMNGTNQITFGVSVLTTYGYQVGYKITGTDIPANTYITAISADGKTVTLSNAATGSTTATVTVTGGTPAAPLWGSGNTSPVNLTGYPTCVAQFSGRAYYGIANGVTYSDSLIPCQITNASQALVLGDSTAVTCIAALPLTSQVTGGTIQSLTVFKGAEQFYQITGDQVTNNLLVAAVPASIGTVCPNSVTETPMGLAFIAPDGLRILQFSGTVSEPLGTHGTGVSVPFLYAVNPTRINMAYNQNTLRVTVQNGNVNGQPFQEWWYDLYLKAWTGPHTFPASLIEPYYAPGIGFIATGVGINAALWSSTCYPSSSSTYTENGTALTFIFQTSLQPDNGENQMNQIVQTTMALALPSAASYNVFAFDEQGTTLGSLQLTGAGGAGSLWDSFSWGASPWGTAAGAFEQYPFYWPNELVFKQMSLQLTGTCLFNAVFGNIYAKYQVLGYMYEPPL